MGMLLTTFIHSFIVEAATSLQAVAAYVTVSVAVAVAVAVAVDVAACVQVCVYVHSQS